MSTAPEVDTPASPPAGAAFAPFYATGAVLAACLSMTTVFQSRAADGITTTFGSLWEMAGAEGGTVAVAGLLVIAGLIALLAFAAIRPARSAGGPAAIAVLSALGLIMIVTRPGTGSPPPVLADGGRMMGALCGALLLLAILHLVRLITRRGERA